MAEADLAIGAGGTTTWKRLYLWLPSIAISIANNQSKICEDCNKQGFIMYLGTYSEVTDDDILKAVRYYILWLWL